MANNKQTKNNSNKDNALLKQIENNKGGYEMRVINGKEWVVPFDKDGKTNPVLDPANPLFDIDKYNAVIAAHDAAYKENLQGIKEGFYNKLKDNYKAETIDNIAEMVTKELQPLLESLSKAINGAVMALSDSTLTQVSDAILEKVYDDDFLLIIQEKQKIYSLMLAELTKKYKGKSFDDLTDEEIEDLWNAVKEAAALEKIPNITTKSNSEFELGIDKLNKVAFSILSPDPKQIEGQITSLSVPQEEMEALKYESDNKKKNKSKREINVYYSYLFDADLIQRFGLSKRVNYYDMFVIQAVENLRLAGNTLISTTQILKELGYGENPGQKQRDKLWDSLYKLLAITIVINDKELRDNWNGLTPGNETYKEIVSPLLPIQIGAEKYRANGKVVDGSIKILGEAPTMMIARAIGQYTTIPKYLLINGEPKTDKYYSVLYYLISRIANYKNPVSTMPNKILYETFYKDLGALGNSKKENACKKILFNLLEHFKKQKYIDDYEEETTKSTGKIGVKFYCRKDKARITQK